MLKTIFLSSQGGEVAEKNHVFLFLNILSPFKYTKA
jgi:hypothetical protein